MGLLDGECGISIANVYFEGTRAEKLSADRGACPAPTSSTTWKKC